MLLCDVESVTPGATLAASVINPALPDMELLKPGVPLDERLLSRLSRLGVKQIWIEHDLAVDLDGAMPRGLGETKIEVYRQLKRDLSNISSKSISVIQINLLRQTIMELVCHVIGSGQLAGVTDRLFSCRPDLFTHGVNVAHLSILVGLELETYVVKERPRLSTEHARDMVSLGLAALLHDIGKLAVDAEPAAIHEIHHDADGDQSTLAAYREHARYGYEMLRESRAPASAIQAVLNHHQRFNGEGWPDLATVFGPRCAGTKSGNSIHIFTRILSAANVLDNLLHTAEGEHRPPIAALWEFASPRFDGWFDPVVRAGVLRRIPPFPVGSQVRLSDGRSAIVSRPRLAAPCRPIVRLMNQGGKSTSGADEQATTLDLTAHPDLYIAQWAGIDVAHWLFDLPDRFQPNQANQQAA